MLAFRAFSRGSRAVAVRRPATASAAAAATAGIRQRGKASAAVVAESGLSRAQLFIDGESVDAEGGRTLPVHSPRDGRAIAEIAHASAADVDRAVRAARRCFNGGAGWSAPENAPSRAAALRAMAAAIRRDQPALARLEVEDCGKPIGEAEADIDACAAYFEYFAGLAEEQLGGPGRRSALPVGSGEPFASSLVREPLGVVGCITPWNYPLMQAVLKVAPALAAGCTVVLKPAPTASLTCARLGRIAADAGVPPGALNVVTGGPPEALEGGDSTGQALIDHPGLDKLSFTGSSAGGRSMLLASAAHLRPTSLELGGKSPAVVFEDAAEIMGPLLDWLLLGIFCTTGQICSATSRVLVQASLHDELLARLQRAAAAVAVGDPLDRATQMGPVASAVQLQRVQTAVRRAAEQGVDVYAPPLPAAVAPDGTGELAAGSYIAPTILSGPAVVGSDAWVEEVFGPVLCVAPFETEAEAVALANDSDYGLAAAVFSTDAVRCHRVADALHAGVVWHNCSQALFNNTPFGGRMGKKSGFGHEMGQAGFDEYVNTKTVVAALDGYSWNWYGAASQPQ